MLPTSLHLYGIWDHEYVTLNKIFDMWDTPFGMLGIIFGMGTPLIVLGTLL